MDVPDPGGLIEDVGYRVKQVVSIDILEKVGYHVKLPYESYNEHSILSFLLWNLFYH